MQTVYYTTELKNLGLYYFTATPPLRRIYMLTLWQQIPKGPYLQYQSLPPSSVLFFAYAEAWKLLKVSKHNFKIITI